MNAPTTRTAGAGTGAAGTTGTRVGTPAGAGRSRTKTTDGTNASRSGATADDLRWLLNGLIDEVPGIRSVVVVSSDGLLLLSSDPGEAQAPEEGSDPAALADAREGPDSAAAPAGWAESARASADGGDGTAAADAAASGGPRGSSADLATVVSGVGSLTLGAAELMDGGAVRQTMVAMNEGALFVMSISDGSLLGVHTDRGCDMNVVAYHMALFVGRAGHVLTPELRNELRTGPRSPAEAAETGGDVTGYGMDDVTA